MKKKLIPFMCASLVFLLCGRSNAQIQLVQDYKNYHSRTIGTFQQIKFREAGFSGLYPIPNTNGKEFWTCSDRGVNVDAANANPSTCRPTYDKIYGFQNYAPKIHRIRLNGDSIQILQTITMKRPNGTGASGLLNPTGFGSTAAEQASTDTVLNCANFNSKIAAKDIWGIDAEGIVVDQFGNFWICEEGGPTIWKLNKNGVVVKRYTPYANLSGAQPQDVQIDEVFKYRKNNRGFEGIAITPSGKIYAIIQSPLLYPTQSVGEGTRIHRILEIDPATGATKMYAYLNDGIIGSSGSNQIRLRDWKIGDMAAINDSTFLVLEAALRGTSDYKRIYTINIKGATAVHGGLYSGVTLEALVDANGLSANSIVPVKKTLFMDLLANGWPSSLEKAEGLAILNDSTIFIGNDNDYGQFSPAENGIATATNIISHVIKYSLKGSNKLKNYEFKKPLLLHGTTAQSSSQSPYLTPSVADAYFTSIVTVGDAVGGYRMVGLPDGLGAFDNGDGTFSILVNHEIGSTSGVTRAHGSRGAFVSKWNIYKSDLSVKSAEDLIKKVNIWSASTSTYTEYSAANPSTLAAFSRFCSADLPAVSAFYNEATGLGTKERIFLNGEESGAEGRGFGHIATGSSAGVTYELPRLGKLSWENALANPGTGDITVVAGLDDATPGQVYFYIGTKTNSGTDIEKAGLTNGKLYGAAVSGLVVEVSGSFPAPGTSFSMVDLGNVANISGSTLQTRSNAAGVTQFLRPEDGAWDPMHPEDFYFVTTNGFGSASRLWKMHFSDISDLTKGGTITAVLSGGEGQQMMDNIGIDNAGHVFIQEDVGGNAHIGKTWQYTIATDALKQVGGHDSTRFLNGGANFLTQDEEASGIIDVQDILGAGMFLVTDQAHYGISGELVEGGQLLAFYNPETALSNPEVKVTGNDNEILDGATTTSTANNTSFGAVNPGEVLSKTYVIHNHGTSDLVISGILLGGADVARFSLSGLPAFPLTLAVGSSQTFDVKFAPVTTGTFTAVVKINNTDFSESQYDFAIEGKGVCADYVVEVSVDPEYPVSGQLRHTIYLGYGTQTVGLTAAAEGSFAPFTYEWSPVTSSSNTIQVSPKVTTDYVVTATNAYGCKSETTQTIDVMDIRDGNKNKVFICHGNHTSSISVNAVPDHLSHGDKLGACLNSAPSALVHSEEHSNIRLFPNPGNDLVTIAVQTETEDMLRFEVMDVQGKLVLSGAEKALNAGLNELPINVSALANGIYYVKVELSTGTTTIELVVAR